MNQDLFFDAMEYIDDDMIEAVDALRTKKKTSVNRTWVRWSSLAACLCMIIGGVWLMSRTDLPDNMEVEDSANTELSDGQSTVHPYISVCVKANGTETTVTDGQNVTAIYDVLRSFYKDSPLYSTDEKADDMGSVEVENEGVIQENVAGGTGDTDRYEIIFTTADGTETAYLIDGSMLVNESSGEHIKLTAEQLTELMDVLKIE